MDTNPLDALFAGNEEPRLDAGPAPETQPAPEAAPKAAAETTPTDVSGATEPPAAPQPPPSPTERETVGFYRAMQEERDKRQALERENAALKARAPAPPQADLPPDVQRQAENYQIRFDVSRELASRYYGADVTQTIHEWAAARCDADPHFNQRMLSSKFPFEAAKEAYDREQILAEVQPGDLASLKEFRAWKAAQAAAPAPAPATPADLPPPRSLADAPGTGSRGAAHIEVSDDAPFKAVFGA